MNATDNRAVVLEFPQQAARSNAPADVALSVKGVWSLLDALDTLDHCLVVTDRSGHVRHASRAFNDQITDPLLRSRIEEFARNAAALGAATGVGASTRAMGSDAVAAPGGAYHMRSTYIGVDLLGYGPTVLVCVTPPTPDPLSLERLCNGLRLTRAQARVAQLLALGLRNNEIAARLFLSAHTVRHHVESIRWKVGGHTRAAIAARLRGDS